MHNIDSETDAVERLLGERELSIDAYWDSVEATTDIPIDQWFNIAHEACDRWAEDPTRLAITFVEGGGRDEWTYARLRDESRRLATAFTAAGLRRGDRVAGLLTKQPEAYVAALAAWRAGMVYVPMFVGLGSEALAHRVRSADPAVVIVNADYRANWAAAAATLGSPPTVWVIDDSGAGLADGDIDLRAAIRKSDTGFTTVRTQADDPATIMFTSGTTGAPKGCVMPHSVPLLNRPFVNHCFGLVPDDVLFAGSDPGWSYGLYTTGFSVLSTGQRIVVRRGKFDPLAWLSTIEDEGVTYIAAAPSALRRLVSTAIAGAGIPASVRGATCGGEPLDAPLVNAWKSLTGGQIRDGYGQTEAAMLLANLEGGPEIVPGSLSSTVPGFEVALLDEYDGTTPLEGPAQGVVAVRKPRYQGTLTYWQQPEKWTARWRGDWFITGDVVRRDEDGRYWFVGRGDDLIITSGYNVGPTEVENVLLADPQVLEAAVVGAPDPDRGAIVRAVIVADPTADRDPLVSRLKEAVRTQVGRHAYPRVIDFVDELPRTESGKVKRNVLRDKVVQPDYQEQR
ncbi:acyl-CoA synthetase [Rhodococcus sp. B50]|uniref:acyl-CoA synthetase n=1 Tax=Rhodococcus sp. B50 TaxID=2682847 RepID=UPI001BD45106|nr:AMP-binding protein [Rhodococcus sp. B50]MBS9376010.1 Acetyl-coenzyme A synthetase [Rhodococcus sp. B50]